MHPDVEQTRLLAATRLLCSPFRSTSEVLLRFLQRSFSCGRDGLEALNIPDHEGVMLRSCGGHMGEGGHVRVKSGLCGGHDHCSTDLSFR